MNYYTLINETLKDERLEFIEEYVEGNNILIHMTLKSIKDDIVCPCCKNKEHIIFFGNKQRKLRTNGIKHYNTFIILHYKRFKCKNCLSIFNDSFSLIENKQKISNALKYSILFDLRKDRSFKDIALENNVSTTEIINIFAEHINQNRGLFKDVVCVDEFKNLSSEDGKYACLFIDPLSSQIIDVLKNRQLDTLREYLYKIPVKERLGVNYFVSDMYEAYRTVAKTLLPNSTHIIDHLCKSLHK